MSRAETIIAAATQAGEDHISEWNPSDYDFNARMKLAYVVGTLQAEIRILCDEIEAKLEVRSAA